MKPVDEIETIQDILDAEKEMVSVAESKYGRDFQNVAGFNDLINNFLKEAKAAFINKFHNNSRGTRGRNPK